MCASTALALTNCRPRAAPRCGLSFTTRAFTATRRARVRAPLPSRLHALRSLRLSAVAAPRPRALNLPPPFPVPGSRFGLPPARRIARWTSPNGLLAQSRNRNAASIHPDLPEMQPSSRRDDADRFLPVLLRLQRVRRTAQAPCRRLLRVLLL